MARLPFHGAASASDMRAQASAHVLGQRQTALAGCSLDGCAQIRLDVDVDEILERKPTGHGALDARMSMRVYPLLMCYTNATPR